MPDEIPTSWDVPEGYVLTWYPPFEFPYPVDPTQTILVYDDDEPFVLDGEFYRPNVSESTLDEFGGMHPGVYALNARGEEPGFDPDTPVHPDAIQVRG